MADPVDQGMEVLWRPLRRRGQDAGPGPLSMLEPEWDSSLGVSRILNVACYEELEGEVRKTLSCCDLQLLQRLPGTNDS